MKLVDHVHVMTKGEIVRSSTPAVIEADEETKHRYLGI